MKDSLKNYRAKEVTTPKGTFYFLEKAIIENGCVTGWGRVGGLRSFDDLISVQQFAKEKIKEINIEPKYHYFKE